MSVCVKTIFPVLSAINPYQLLAIKPWVIKRVDDSPCLAYQDGGTDRPLSSSYRRPWVWSCPFFGPRCNICSLLLMCTQRVVESFQVFRQSVGSGGLKDLLRLLVT